MRILHIALHFAEYANRLSRSLASEHDICLVCDRTNAVNELGEVPQSSGNLTVFPMPNRGLRDPRIILDALRLARCVQSFNPDVIHCQDAPRDYLMALFPLLRRYPLVLTVHDPVPHAGQDSIDRWRMVHYRKILRRSADGIIVHGAELKRLTETINPWLAGRVYSVPHGPLGAAPPDGPAGYERAHLLFFGRIERYKGLGTLLDAVELLTERGVAYRLTIAGRGSDLERHRVRISRNKNIELIEGFVPAAEVARLFSAAHLVLMPYDEASQSGVGAMALGAARPVVASDVGSLSEAIRDGENGFLVPPRNPTAFADAITTVISDDVLTARLCEGAKALAGGVLSWASIARQTLDVYAQTVAAWHSR
jgi:glycosyltransferase involved in cell wall biosynthesis